MQEWIKELQQMVNTREKLADYVDITPDEDAAIATMRTRWGTTPYFASLMDPQDPACPIRRQVGPSLKEKENKYGIQDYLIHKENRAVG